MLVSTLRAAACNFVGNAIQAAQKCSHCRNCTKICCPHSPPQPRAATQGLTAWHSQSCKGFPKRLRSKVPQKCETGGPKGPTSSAQHAATLAMPKYWGIRPENVLHEQHTEPADPLCVSQHAVYEHCDARVHWGHMFFPIMGSISQKQALVAGISSIVT